MSVRIAGRPGIAAAAVLLALAGSFSTPSGASASGVSKVFYHGPRTEPVIALTFDDGWNPANCERVAKILQANGATATFFPSARWVRRAPAFWKQLAASFPFGDHTTDHPHMTGLSYASQYDEIDSDRRIVERITGVPLIRVFRAPYGELDSTTLAAAAAAGFPITMEWDVNVYDITRASDAELFAQATSGRHGSVVTMHCGAAPTVRILPAVIDYYRAHGFTFVTVPELLSGAVPSPTASAERASPAPPAAALAGPPSPPGSRDVRPTAPRSIPLLIALTVASAAAVVLLLGAHRRGARAGHVGGPQGPSPG